MSIIEHVTSLKQLVTIEEMDLEERGERLADLMAENAKLRGEVAQMYREMQGVLDESNDTVWVGPGCTLRDAMDYHMRTMNALGFPPDDYDQRVIELGWTVVE